MNITSPKYDNHEIELVKECLESGWVTMGPFVNRFETEFALRHKINHALATTSCTAALHLATMALGLGPGDEVIVPAFTWVTSAHCAEYVGARVRFADVEPDTFNLDPDAFEAAITPRTRAVVVVHLFGLAARMDRILEICNNHGLFIIEDAACAVGTTYDGRPVGGLGDIGCFSFHPRKVITTGEGGMVTTDKTEYAEKIVSLRSHGAGGIPEGAKPAPYTMARFDVLGFNLRMSDIQAAVGIAQMAKLDNLLSERRRLAERYNVILNGIEEIALPSIPEKCGHTYQSYVIRIIKGGITKRNQIMEALDKKSIQTRPGTHAVHRLGYYTHKYGLKAKNFPVASACEDTSITLPIFPSMSENDVNYVVNQIENSIIAK